MYIRFDVPERRLEDLQYILFGYSMAIESHRIEECGRSFMRNFGISSDASEAGVSRPGVVVAIRSNCAGEDEAWSMFWSLVDEYREEVSRAPPLPDKK
jgi:hypothetical protein